MLTFPTNTNLWDIRTILVEDLLSSLFCISQEFCHNVTTDVNNLCYLFFQHFVAYLPSAQNHLYG